VSELQLAPPTGLVLLGGTADEGVYGARFLVGEERGELMQWPEDFPSGGLQVFVPKWCSRRCTRRPCCARGRDTTTRRWCATCVPRPRRSAAAWVLHVPHGVIPAGARGGRLVCDDVLPACRHW